MAQAQLKTLPYPLAEWLYLSGVQYEISEEACVWGGAEKEYVSSSVTSVPSPGPIPVQSPTAPRERPSSLPHFIDLAAFNSYIATWRGLGLCSTATHAVLGQGSLQPRVMVIAEAPDDAEDRSGETFSGAAHQLVIQALTAAGFDKADIYVTYLSKWRPPGQRSLGKHEVTPLSAMLWEEIRLVRPKALLVLGEGLARAIGGDSLPTSGLLGKILSINNQIDNLNLSFLASQKAETLLKTPSMKKTFWFSLLSYTATLRAQAAPHNLEYQQRS